MSEKSWFAVEITAAPHAADAVEHFLNEFDALGTEIDQLRKKSDADVTVVGYFDQQPDELEIRQQLESVLEAFDLDSSVIRSLTHKVVENADWLSEWKKHWRPTRVGKFVIAPSWYEIEDDPDTILIRIEPNMAFGTGTHETTRLCLKAIDELYRPETSFLDVGTGTGILAIAAAKIQGKSYAFRRENESASPADQKVLAIELDPDSVVIALENATANGVGDDIEFVHGTLSNETPSFDFVCANLTLDVILPMLDLLIETAKRFLILSGILVEQQAQITNELRKLGVDKPLIERDGEWIAISIKR